MGFRLAFLVGHSFALSPPDLPPNAIRMEPAGDLLELRIQVDGVKGEPPDGLNFLSRSCGGCSRTNLDVVPPLPCAIAFHRLKQALQVFAPSDERFAVVRERKRNHPAPGDPTGHPAEHDPVRELDTTRRGRVSQRLVSIRTPKRLQPARRVKHRGLRVAVGRTPPPLGPKRAPGASGHASKP